MSERKPLGGHTEKKAIDVVAQQENNPPPTADQIGDELNEPTQKLEVMVTVMMLLESGNVVNTIILRNLTKDKELCKMAERNIKAHFEANNSFAKCFNSADILKRIQTIIQQNIIFGELGLSKISLTNSGGESLLDVKIELGTEPIIVELIRDIENNIPKGKNFVESSVSYKKITSKYGLKEAVDRWLQPLS